MSNKHLEIFARAALSAVPVVGGPAEVVVSGYRDRATERARDFVGVLLDRFEDAGQLDARLAESDRLDAVFCRALQAAAVTGLAQKRIALGRVLLAGIDDEAHVDEAALLVDALSQIEAPHVRALAAIAEAVDAVKTQGTWPQRALGAEHEIVAAVVRVGSQFSDSVVRTLKNLGLLFAGESTDQWLAHDLTPFGYDLLQLLSESDQDLLDDTRADGSE